MSKQRATKSAKSGTEKGASHRGPFRVAACWPHQEAPLILAMLGEGRTALATSMTPISFDMLLNLKLAELSDPSFNAPDYKDLPRWLFAVPYEYFGNDVRAQQNERVIAWEVKAALVWDSGKSEPRYVARSDAKSARFHLDPTRELKTLLADAQKWNPCDPAPVELLPTTSDDSYLDSARSIIDSIREGDFYQVNLLRYFQAPKAGGWENICMRLEQNSGPYGCILTQGSRIIASFSPERFIEITPQVSGATISTWPIKGTSQRVPSDQLADEKVGQKLLESEKDLAELRMIIDLMRNDLGKVCKPGSIQVLSGGCLKKFASVWHLEGEVTGQLRTNITLRELLSALCPGGSITGAPKIAAMERIRSEEGQDRGFFMGNVFTIMHDGSLKSNILIRTLVSDNWMRTARYAAGSGLVIKSSPEMELKEVKSKCIVLTGMQP